MTHSYPAVTLCIGEKKKGVHCHLKKVIEILKHMYIFIFKWPFLQATLNRIHSSFPFIL